MIDTLRECERQRGGASPPYYADCVAKIEERFEFEEGETGGKSKSLCCCLLVGEFVGYRGYCWQAQRKVVGR